MASRSAVSLTISMRAPWPRQFAAAPRSRAAFRALERQMRACNLIRPRLRSHHWTDGICTKEAGSIVARRANGRDLPITGPGRTPPHLARPLHERVWRSRCHKAWRIEIAGAPESRHRGSILLWAAPGAGGKCPTPGGEWAGQPLQDLQSENAPLAREKSIGVSGPSPNE